MRRRPASSIYALALLLAPGDAPPALAQGVTCGTIWPLDVSADSVSFGTYTPSSGAAATANGRITVACSSDLPGVYLPSFNVALSQGSGGSGFNPRQMSNGAARLNYNLYINAGFTVVWGDGTGGTQVQSNAAGTNQRSASMTMYGRVPASQSSASGAFTDTINVTVTY
jgi:spore coat protein U-like protein